MSREDPVPGGPGPVLTWARVRVVEGLLRQEALPVLRVPRGAELPRRFPVRREAAGQRRHEAGAERHARREAGAEAALQVVTGGQSRRRLQHHGPVGHEHRVPGVHEGPGTGRRRPADQGVDAEGGGAAQGPRHHHEGRRAERRAHRGAGGAPEESRWSPVKSRGVR